MLKLTKDKQTDEQTNKQTGQKQCAPDHSIRDIIKIALFISLSTCCMNITRGPRGPFAHPNTIRASVF